MKVRFAGYDEPYAPAVRLPISSGDDSWPTMEVDLGDPDERGRRLPIPVPNSEEIIEAMPVEVVFDILKVNLIPKKSLDKELTLSLFFSDTSKSFTLILRKGVLEVQPFEVKGAKVKVYTEEKIWKEIVAGTRSLPVSMATGMISVEGDKVSLISFFNSFRE